MSITSFTGQKCSASRAEEEMTANGTGGFHYRLFDLVRCCRGFPHYWAILKIQRGSIALYNVPQLPKGVFVDKET